MLKRIVLPVIAVLALVLLIAACSSDDDGGDGGIGEEPTVSTADDEGGGEEPAVPFAESCQKTDEKQFSAACFLKITTLIVKFLNGLRLVKNILAYHLKFVSYYCISNGFVANTFFAVVVFLKYVIVGLKRKKSLLEV